MRVDNGYIRKGESNPEQVSFKRTEYWKKPGGTGHSSKGREKGSGSQGVDTRVTSPSCTVGSDPAESGHGGTEPYVQSPSAGYLELPEEHRLPEDLIEVYVVS